MNRLCGIKKSSAAYNCHTFQPQSGSFLYDGYDPKLSIDRQFIHIFKLGVSMMYQYCEEKVVPTFS
jgi:hypothetical protein